MRTGRTAHKDAADKLKEFFVFIHPMNLFQPN